MATLETPSTGTATLNTDGCPRKTGLTVEHSQVTIDIEDVLIQYKDILVMHRLGFCKRVQPSLSILIADVRKHMFWKRTLNTNVMPIGVKYTCNMHIKMCCVFIPSHRDFFQCSPYQCPASY